MFSPTGPLDQWKKNKWKRKSGLPSWFALWFLFGLYCGDDYFSSFLPRWEETFWWTFSLEVDLTAGRTQPYFPIWDYWSVLAFLCPIWCSGKKSCLCLHCSLCRLFIFQRWNSALLSLLLIWIQLEGLSRFCLQSKETDLWNTFLKTLK